MNTIQKKQIIDSQRDALRRYGYHPNALYWSNQEVQQLRFKKLLEIGIGTNDSILDVGCGFGDLSAYLLAHDKKGKYTGIDLSAELLVEAQKRYPTIVLLEGDLFEVDTVDNSYDYVVLSGTLNRNLNDEGAYAYRTIEKMLQICKKGLAFNLLDARHEWTESRWDLQSFYPKDVLEYVEQFSSRSQLIEGYLENDFTLLVWK